MSIKTIIFFGLVLSFCLSSFWVSAQDNEETILINVVELMPFFRSCDTLERQEIVPDAVTRSALKACSEKKLLRYIYQNLEYPEVAKQEGLEGMVVAQFVITKAGAIADAKILKGIGGGCDEEALRVIRAMNEAGMLWVPAEHNGKTVAVRYNLPIRFRIKQENPKTQEIAKKPLVFEADVVETMPVFPGCEHLSDITECRKCTEIELLKYMYLNIQYPRLARENGIQGLVVVEFIITKEGKIINPKITKKLGGGCDEEVLRLVNEMNELNPGWTPGTQNGKPVQVRYNLPIRFKLAVDSSPQPTYSRPPRKKRDKKKKKSDN